MKISVKVKPGSKSARIEKTSETTFAVSVKSPPQEGKANEALIAILSDYFNVPKSRITLLKGTRSKHKLVEILL